MNILIVNPDGTPFMEISIAGKVQAIAAKVVTVPGGELRHKFFVNGKEMVLVRPTPKRESNLITLKG